MCKKNIEKGWIGQIPVIFKNLSILEILNLQFSLIVKFSSIIQQVIHILRSEP